MWPKDSRKAAKQSAHRRASRFRVLCGKPLPLPLLWPVNLLVLVVLDVALALLGKACFVRLLEGLALRELRKKLQL